MWDILLRTHHTRDSMKKSDRKERHEAIEMEFSEPTRVDGIRFHGNSFELLSAGKVVEPRTSSYVKYYNRDSGKEKITLRFDLDRPTLGSAVVPKKTSVVIIIDTNTKGERSASVAAFHLVTQNTDVLELYYLGILYWKFVNKTQIHSEKIAMDNLFKNIKAGRIPYILNNDTILAITDHNLGKLERLNRREEPLIEEDDTSYIPENITLAYASADKKNDSIFNEMIAECDRCAAELINNWGKCREYRI